MNLGKGSQGPNVRRLQTSLNLLATASGSGGSALEPLKEDGIFGPKTQARVIEFQRQASLRADGVVGPRTAKALFGSVTGALFRLNT